MSNQRRSLTNTKPRDNRQRSKPLVAKAGVTRRRTPYKCGGKVNK